MTQEIHGFIGVPGSGKSTLTKTYDPMKWVVCNFDSLRQSMWPPHRRVYWDVRVGPLGDAAQNVLHAVHDTVITRALENGFNVVSDDTNTNFEYASNIIKIAEIYNIEIKWMVLDIPWHILQQRNNDRTKDFDQVPENILRQKFEQLWASDAWWREQPNVTVIPYQPFDLKAADTPEEVLAKLIVDYPKTAERAKTDETRRHMFENMLEERFGIDDDEGINIVRDLVSRTFSA